MWLRMNVSYFLGWKNHNKGSSYFWGSICICPSFALAFFHKNWLNRFCSARRQPASLVGARCTPGRSRVSCLRRVALQIGSRNSFLEIQIIVKLIWSGWSQRGKSFWQVFVSMGLHLCLIMPASSRTRSVLDKISLDNNWFLCLIPCIFRTSTIR